MIELEAFCTTHSSVLVGAVFATVWALFFASSIMCHEWRLYCARLLREMEELFGHQDRIFPNFRRLGKMMDCLSWESYYDEKERPYYGAACSSVAWKDSGTGRLRGTRTFYPGFQRRDSSILP